MPKKNYLIGAIPHSRQGSTSPGIRTVDAPGKAFLIQDRDGDVPTSLTALAAVNSQGDLVPFGPIPKGRIFNTAIANDTTDFFLADLAGTGSPCIFRVDVTLSASSVLTARVTSAGTAVNTLINSGNTLNANARYTFDLRVRAGDTVNFRQGVVGGLTIVYMLIDEVDNE